jgi:hypothetical protein
LLDGDDRGEPSSRSGLPAKAIADVPSALTFPIMKGWLSNLLNSSTSSRFSHMQNQTDLFEQESPRDKASIALAAMDR